MAKSSRSSVSPAKGRQSFFQFGEFPVILKKWLKTRRNLIKNEESIILMWWKVV
ncbi:hypothetical protein E6C60_1513 [Paenibacillus algicola]|uniref:Uncharacterized protein n=1 Tax=Paenibacillus algicola TaxID=2565926 RepID=A0A4P8XPD3_9BACL|nr:hypothetical protein E6C60_1513 [Paenibacillus algicola]